MTPFLLPQIEISYPNARLSIKTFMRQKILTASSQHHFLSELHFFDQWRANFMWRPLYSKGMFWSPEEHGVWQNTRYVWTSSRTVYKAFWRDISSFLISALNYGFDSGHLSVTQRRGVIKLIPKKDAELYFIKNWRPITLLNTDYKIAGKAIVNRIKLVLSKTQFDRCW